MKKTKGIQKLIKDAIAAGYTIEEDNSSVAIRKGKGKFPKGIFIYQNNKAVRTDVPLEVCKIIQTQKQIRKVLNL